MHRIITLILLAFSFSVPAQHDTFITQLYKQADIVVHARIISLGPTLTQEMGTDWYYPRYSILKMYKQAIPISDTSFALMHSGYAPLDSSMIHEGGEYILFLRCGNLEDAGSKCALDGKSGGYPVPVKGGIIPFCPELDKRVDQFRHATSFDRAVTQGKWNVVKRKIHRRVSLEGKLAGKNTGTAVLKVQNWLRSHNTVYLLYNDSCFGHICIYPGFSVSGMILLTEKGSEEWALTINLGKVFRWGCIYNWVGLDASKDRAYFKNLAPSPGFYKQHADACRMDFFQRLRYYKAQPDIEIKTELLEDTLYLTPMTPPLIRVKVSMINRSDQPLNVYWPDMQNDYDKVILFKMNEREGAELIEEGEFVEMNHNETLGPSLVVLPAGDTLSAWHSINDPYTCYTDVTAHHRIDFIPEGSWVLSMKYIPQSLTGDTTGFWRPEGGSRSVAAQDVITVKWAESYEPFTIKGMMISQWGAYTNYFGQHGVYNGMVKVMEAPENSPVREGDTIAYRISFNMQYFEQADFPHPALESQLAKPFDILTLKVNTTFPPDEFALPGKGKYRNFLLSNDGDALKRGF